MERTEEQLERIRDFVAALRSGKYTQGKHILSTVQDGRTVYCCEGVAAERYGEALGYGIERNDLGTLIMRRIASPDDEDNLATVADRGTHLTAYTEFWHDMGLLEELDDKSFKFYLPDGLRTRDDHDNGEGPQNVLAYTELNDDEHGLTFDQIADLIEWQFLSCPRD